MVAAIEIFNKPAFSYREETFALLALNAWELLLKGQVLRANGNKVKAIRVYEPRTNKTTGEPSTKLYLKLNRAKNPMTIGMGKCITILDTSPATRIDPTLKANIDALMEIRDNAAHYITASPALAKHTLEIGTASVVNFIQAAKAWFKRDFSKTLSLLLPIGFIDASHAGTVLTAGPDERKLVEYLRTLANTSAVGVSPYTVALSLNIAMVKSALDGKASKVVIAYGDPSAIPVTLKMDDILATFPWDYDTMVGKLMAKHPGLKRNSAFHAFCSKIKANPLLCVVRYLDPVKASGMKKEYYSPNVIAAYATHITQP